ncbi:MAG: hypothetical protein ACTSSH_12555, partial [Candidatus Heimdallarchaeota archaeon]
TWEDSTLSDELYRWNKTGMIDDDDAEWELLDAEEDFLLIGFSNQSFTDYWIWSASNRTDGSFAYEVDFNGIQDFGDLPFIINSNDTSTFYGNVKPIFNNTFDIIANYSTIPEGEHINAFYPQTPTGSQSDVNISWNFEDYNPEGYTLEIVRKLDTGNFDDINFLTNELKDLTFRIAGRNRDDVIDLIISTAAYTINYTNEPSTFTWNTVSSEITSDLFILGTVYDDYQDFDLTVSLSGWDNTYGPNSFDNIYVNPFTGEWSYLFLYDQDDMPLGDHQILVDFQPKYDDHINLVQNITISDNEAPRILGVVDIGERYPYGVSNTTLWLDFTAGLTDNYNSNEDLTAYLFISKDDGIALQYPMTQFIWGSLTFVVNYTLNYESNADNNYTYFVEVWDTSLNKRVSEKMWFIVGQHVNTYPNLFDDIARWGTYAILAFGSVVVVGTITLVVIKIRKRMVKQ